MSKDRAALELQETELSRSMSEFDITLIGVGAMIGAGIFVLIGIATGEAGPGVMVALVLNGVVTLFTAMVYAELGSAIPEAGGGYLWVKDALGRQQSFLAGWMSWFSHSVAGALYALGFGSFVVELVRRGGLVMPDLGPATANKWVAAMIVLAFLGINLRGASETGLAGNIITIAKISVIGLFVAFGIAAIFGSPADSLDRFQPMFPQGAGGVLTAMGLTFIAFEGYEIIVQAGEEVKDPAKAIPRAVFKSLIIVIPIYALVAFTMIGAVDPPAGSTIGEFLGEAGELGLAEAADSIMPAGAIVILVGGILSTISALNATTYSSTRVSYAMGRDRVMPDAFASVHERFRTPHVALAATGVLILFMVFFLPIEAVAAAADVMFLLLFLQVHYAVIRIRGEMGDRIDYGYIMPWYPWVPLAGIVLNAGLAIFLVFYELVGWLVAVGWIAIGVAVFFLYSRGRVREEDEPTVTYEDKSGSRTGRAVLAPVGHPDHVEAVLAVAAAWARTIDAEVVALTVVRVPPGLRLAEGRGMTDRATPVIDRIREFANATDDVRVSIVVAAGRSISGVIDSIADREGAGVVVLGWKGTVHPDTVRGSVAQQVLLTSSVQTLVVKAAGFPDTLRAVIVAISPGLRGSETLAASATLADGLGVDLHLATVVAEDGDHEELAVWLDEVRERLLDDTDLPADRIHVDLRRGGDVVGALADAAGDDAILVVGSSRDWVLRENLFGEFTDELANRARSPVVMVHRPESTPVSAWRQVAGSMRRGGHGRARHARSPS